MAETFFKLLIYGDDTTTSRNFLLSVRKRYEVVELVAAADMDLPTLEEKILTDSMFASGNKLVVIEGAPKANHAEFLDTAEQNIVIWIEGKPAVIAGKLGQALPTFTKKEFPQLIPTTAFVLVNPFFSKELTKSLLAIDTIHEKKIPLELVIGALNFRLRQLIILQTDGSLAKVTPNQLTKLTRELTRWSANQLRSVYDALIDLDFKSKNGTIQYKQGLIALVYEFLL